MSSPYADQLAAVRALLPGLVPVTNPTQRFTAASGDLDVDREPGVLFRRFEVVADPDAPLTRGYMATRSRQARKRFTINVRYDSRHDIPLTDQLIAEDDDLVIANVEAPAGFAAGVQMVTCTGGKLRKEEDAWQRALVFEVVYVHGF